MLPPNRLELNYNQEVGALLSGQGLEAGGVGVREAWGSVMSLVSNLDSIVV